MANPWGRRLFVTGAVVLLILGAVHSLSFINPLAPSNPTEKQLLDLMENYKFDLTGTMRSMGSLFEGFSISFMLTSFVVGALDLAVSRERLGLLKRMALVNVLWLLAMLAVSLRYFFPVPTAFITFTLVIVVAAWAGMPKETAEG